MMTRPPRRVSEESLNALEDEAYQSAEEAPAREDGAYGRLGPAVYAKAYRPDVLEEWPIHTDFRQHETTPEERGRD